MLLSSSSPSAHTQQALQSKACRYKSLSHQQGGVARTQLAREAGRGIMIVMIIIIILALLDVAAHPGSRGRSSSGKQTGTLALRCPQVLAVRMGLAPCTASPGACRAGRSGGSESWGSSLLTHVHPPHTECPFDCQEAEDPFGKPHWRGEGWTVAILEGGRQHLCRR